ncbi:conserved phage C-terminal domain-containing protein [Peribacillus sp. NPDC097295]|uniref:conserved phage C-terminal domain-containing protein n=1 Tax=Peribacillus sp. NPDC097295 TaxID=3364402 RepID=UPI00381B721A
MKFVNQRKTVILYVELATKIGLNEAIVLQHLSACLEESMYKRDGRFWVQHTYQEWQEQLPFWSHGTIKRIFTTLEKTGYIRTANYNHLKMDRTKWYSLNYSKLASLDGAVRDEIKILPQSTDSVPYKEILKYFHDKTNASYHLNTRRTKTLIQSRFNEGFTLAHFYQVIDSKCAEWLYHPYYRKYLHPETLFGPRFETYLTQISESP